MNFIRVLFLTLLMITGILTLDPEKRPDNLKKSIQASFVNISSNLQPWNYNGSETYNFLKIDAAEFVKTIIKAATPAQKDFYVLDIGAGKFQWGLSAAEYINKQHDIPGDVTVHIMSVTGENYGPLKTYQFGCCKLYDIGAFQIENLKESFTKLDMNFDQKLDLIVSGYTFLHLHDPVGTFVQAYNLLRPETGMILMEGFPFYFESKEDLSKVQAYINMAIFLYFTNAPFLIGEGRSDRGFISFLLRRPNQKILDLPLKYEGILSTQVANTMRKNVAYFNWLRNPSRKFRQLDIDFRTCLFYGDKNLYEWVYSHYPYWKIIDTSWGPFFEDDHSKRIEHKGIRDLAAEQETKKRAAKALIRVGIFPQIIAETYSLSLEEVKKLAEEVATESSKK